MALMIAFSRIKNPELCTKNKIASIIPIHKMVIAEYDIHSESVGIGSEKYCHSLVRVGLLA
jgi:hypothetical protein